jgi:alkylation response protein AidB-like acyl-CoA dehydrogenase
LLFVDPRDLIRKMTSLTRIGLRTLSRLAGSRRLDQTGLRKPTEHALHHGTRLGFKAVIATSRAFKSVQQLGAPQRLARGPAADLFDLRPSDDQQALQEAARTFAMERLRPAASAADAAGVAPADLMAECAELGFAALGIPEGRGGLGTERSAVTNALIASAMAEGDMGLAWAALAPSAVSGALVAWGNADQQARYLSAFAGERPPAAALAVQEPTPLFDPFELRTQAVAQGGGYVLQGVKSMVPLAGRAELFIVAAMVHGKGPGLFIVESSTAGLSVEEDRAMGLRAAGTARLHLDGVKVPATALISDASQDVYRECITLSRLAWCAMGTGCAQGVLDFIVPYVNDRQAFGEPISHRQSVAFAVSNMAIELNAMRLLTWRAASLVDADVDYMEAAALARRLCADKGMQIGSDGVQLLGGHGFVTEYPVERWYRDLRAIGVMEGGLLI